MEWFGWIQNIHKPHGDERCLFKTNPGFKKDSAWPVPTSQAGETTLIQLHWEESHMCEGSQLPLTDTLHTGTEPLGAGDGSGLNHHQHFCIDGETEVKKRSRLAQDHM